MQLMVYLLSLVLAFQQMYREYSVASGPCEPHCVHGDISSQQLQHTKGSIKPYHKNTGFVPLIEKTAWFMSNLFGDHIVSFFMTQL